MSQKILLHKRTDSQIQALLNNPPQAILIIGPAGSGKKTVAHYIAANLLGVSLDRLELQPYFVKLASPPGKREIPIQAVRDLIKSLRLKTAGYRRVVLIDEAHTLSEEAQNALLKAIEEPPSNSLFILTSTTKNNLLPTIVSRSQRLNVYPPSQDETVSYFKEEFSTGDITSAWSLSRGSSGLISAILEDKAEHQIKQAVDQAKLFLKKDQFERLVFLDSLAGSKDNLAAFLDALARVYAALSSSAIQRDNHGQLQKLIGSRRLVAAAMESLNKNVSARLISLHLALSLSI